MSRQQIDITGAPGVGVDAEALKSQEERLLEFTKQASEFIEKLQGILLSRGVLFAMFTFIIMLTIEVIWGSYFKTKYSDSFAKDLSTLERSIMYFSWIGGTVFIVGTSLYFAGLFMLGDKFGENEKQILMAITGAIMLLYLINTIIAGANNASSYTILGNFLAIK
jgi:hypothetical protein